MGMMWTSQWNYKRNQNLKLLLPVAAENDLKKHVSDSAPVCIRVLGHSGILTLGNSTLVAKKHVEQIANSWYIAKIWKHIVWRLRAVFAWFACQCFKSFQVEIAQDWFWMFLMCENLHVADTAHFAPEWSESPVIAAITRCPHAGSRNNPIWGKQKFCGSRFCLAWNSYAFGTGHTYRPWSENLRYSQGLPHWFTVWLYHLYLQLIVLCSRHFVEALNLMRKATYEHMCSISLSACWDSRHLLSQSYILPSDTYRD